MDPKRKTTEQKPLSKAGSPGSLGSLLLSAAVWSVSPRAAGQGLIAFGERLEKLFAATKTTLWLHPQPEKSPFCPQEPVLKKHPPIETEDVEIPQKAPDTAVQKQKENEPAAPDVATNGELQLVDIREQPEAYAAMLAREREGRSTLITRYRRSYESRLIQSKDPMQDYYSGMKNALLRYKGVKSRVSWANETFHQGRNHIAKIIVKTSCLYIYLAIDPELLTGTKFESAIGDVSDKKKFGEFPTVIKIKGERKYKYVLELIDRICAEDLALPLNKKFEEIDYKRPNQTDEQLVAAGLIKMLVAEVKNPTKAE